MNCGNFLDDVKWIMTILVSVCCGFLYPLFECLSVSLMVYVD